MLFTKFTDIRLSPLEVRSNEVENHELIAHLYKNSSAQKVLASNKIKLVHPDSNFKGCASERHVCLFLYLWLCMFQSLIFSTWLCGMWSYDV